MPSCLHCGSPISDWGYCGRECELAAAAVSTAEGRKALVRRPLPPIVPEAVARAMEAGRRSYEQHLANPHEAVERRRQAIVMRRNGMTYREIGDRLGVGPARARQIYIGALRRGYGDVS